MFEGNGDLSLERSCVEPLHSPICKTIIKEMMQTPDARASIK